MVSHPPLKLSRLRDIGFSEWDPIGIFSNEPWDRQPWADEYDAYLLEVAGRLMRDWSVSDAASYLVGVEKEHMGLGVGATTFSRAETVAKAIKAYLDESDASLL